MTEFPGRYPATRLRRFRQAAWSRNLVQENHLRSSDLILPLFVRDGKSIREPIASLPGVDRQSIDVLIETVREAASLGICAVALFPVVDASLKSADGGEALNPDNLICRTIRQLKEAVPNIGIVADIALDPYTDHGHDGVLREGVVANDATVVKLVEQALTLVEAGCDILAPSEMMDGRIGAIRDVLEQTHHPDTLILSYAVKYASALYGPFRDAVGSSGALGGASKATYQMNPANTEEALREVALDLAEGADAVMVKPGLSYLDVIQRISERFPVPVFAYHVSGEFAMVKAAGQAGMLNADAVIDEHLLAMKRAGATAIITYAAMDAARRLKGDP